MRISYDPKEDIVFIKLNDAPIVKDVSYGWNVNIGVTEKGVGEITLLDAKASHFLPLELSQDLMKEHQVVTH